MIKTIFFIFSLLSISCNPQNNKKTELAFVVIGDSTYCNQLKIDNLKESLEDFQIRIWITFSLIDSGKVINLKNEAGSWKGEFYLYRFDLDNNLNKRVLKNKNKINGHPKSGWNSFLSKVEKLGLYNLNDNDRKNNFGLCTDANIISVEIVRDKKYIEYRYPCWDAIEDQTQINKVKSILQFIQEEFGFKVFPIL